MTSAMSLGVMEGTLVGMKKLGKDPLSTSVAIGTRTTDKDKLYLDWGLS